MYYRVNEEYILPIFKENETELNENKQVLERKNPRFRQELWDKTGMRTISARLPTRTAERFKAYCDAQGKTRHAVLVEWIKAHMEPVTELSTVHKDGSGWCKI